MTGVLQGVVDQILNDLNDLVPVAGDRRPALPQVGLDGHAALTRDDADGVHHVRSRPRQVDPAQGRNVLVQLDPAQRQQIGDQPPHAVGLDGHDVEKLVARLGVVLGVALQGFDEARQRGQGRAQFVAGVGQEVDAHHFHAAGVGLVAQGQQGQGARAPQMGVPLGQGPDEGPPVPLLGAAADIVDRAAEIAEQGLVHRLQHLGVADHRDQQPPARPVQTKQFARGGVGQGDPPPGDIVGFAAADDQDRIAQGFKDITQQRAVGDQIDRPAAVQFTDADQGRRTAIDQPCRRRDSHGARRQPA